MVLFFTSSSHNPPVMIYMGKDKFENEDLIKYAWPQDVWFHVDKLSSAHVYLRMPEGMTWDTIPEPLLIDCAQLVKANSIEGNKKDDITIIWTPGDNLKKSGDMAVGQVSFHNDKKVKRIYVAKRENAIVNRLNKTKTERQVDHEQERVDRVKAENAVKRARGAEGHSHARPRSPPPRRRLIPGSFVQKKADAELAKAREAEKAARSYDNLFNGDGEGDDDDDEPRQSVQEMMDDFM
ncbi:cytoplasmic protein [Epithele typhae]|uniref:cytoplasmic protein n=1 Tax=Epithele typhae TaxID=378194 RepID=UPI002007B578|nr:cytoplasmic protein [Epithele typhae]KAH9932765.1 cytoplasmic protein [Epithele typhae]